MKTIKTTWNFENNKNWNFGNNKNWNFENNKNWNFENNKNWNFGKKETSIFTRGGELKYFFIFNIFNMSDVY